MNATRTIALVLFVVQLVGCKPKTQLADAELRQFVETRLSQTREVVKKNGAKMPPDWERLFGAVLADDFSTATNLFGRLAMDRYSFTNPPSAIAKAADQIKDTLAQRGWYTPTSDPASGAAWQTLSEAFWAYSEAKAWDSPFLSEIVSEIISSVPTNAVYFGGTGVGRFSVTAKLEIKNEKKVLSLTQNQLMDYSYLDYAQWKYGKLLVLPDINQCSAAWTQLFGTNANPTQAALMQKNGELLRSILALNHGPEYFIEQEFIIEWLYPHLEPHGPIQKINRQTLSRLPEELVEADRAYWMEFCRKFIGDWIKPLVTSPTDVSEFCERVYVRGETDSFNGDRAYLRSRRAQDYFSKLRLATARLYLWHCVKADAPQEKDRMAWECYLAFEQAFALGPGNSEVALGFANVLCQIQGYEEAIRILRISQSLNPSNEQIRSEIEQIQQLMKRP